MVPTDHLLAFAVTSLVLIAAPGPSVLFVISRALVLGRSGALATVVGNGLGVYVQVIAVAFGIGAVVERSVAAFTAVKLAGATYLIYLGVHAIRHRSTLRANIQTAGGPAGAWSALRQGALVGVANPKAVVFFTAVLPQFVDRDAGRLPVQMLLLGACFVSIGLFSDGLWALAASRARRWFARSPQRLSALGGAGGAVMIGLGARLALTGRHD